MNEKFFKEVIVGIIKQNAVALGVVTQALSQQIDASRLTEDLRRYIAAAKSTGDLDKIGEQIAMGAMAGAEAESALQRQKNH